MPVAGNSGVPAGTRLADKGSISASTPGQVISGVHVTGTITVSASNVTIENSKINSTGQYWAINVKGGVTGLKVIHNEIYTTTGGYEGIFAYSGVGMFACGNYLHNYENPMTIGDRAVIQSNYVDKMQAAPGNCDDDGIEIYHGNHIRIWGNNIYAYAPDGHSVSCVNSALYTGDETNTPQTDIDINNNWIGGGLYTLRIEGSGPAHNIAVTDVRVRNNRWWYTAATSGDKYGPVAVRRAGMISEWTNNKWMGNGAPLNEPLP